MRIVRVATALGLAAGLLGPAEPVGASGPEVAVLAVAPPPGPDPALVELAAALRAGLSARRAGVLDPGVVRDRMAGPDPAAALAELERAQEAARALYVRGDREGSVRGLQAAASAIERLPPGPEPHALWTRVVLRLARTQLNLGHEQAARASRARLLRAAPDVQVDRTLYPESFAQWVERGREELRRQPTRRLTVTATAPGARVFLNGRDLGPAPVIVAVPAGSWRLEGVRDGLVAGKVSLELGDADAEVRLDFALAEALRPDAGPGLVAAPGDRAVVLAAGLRLDLPQLVTASVSDEPDGTYLVGALHDVTLGSRIREGRVRLQAGQPPPEAVLALAAFLDSGQRAPGLVEVDDERTSLLVDPALALSAAGGPGAGLRSHAPARRGYLTGATVAAALSVALATYGVLERRAAVEAYDRAEALRAGGPFLTSAEALRASNAHVREGDAARSRAIAAGVGAATSAVAAGVLGYLAWRAEAAAPHRGDGR